MKLQKNKIIFAILIIIIFLLISFLLYFKLLKNNSIENLKLDNTKEWVYDAMYTSDITQTSYKVNLITYYLKDIKVPYINVNSDDATTINEELESIYNNAISAYKEGLVDGLTHVEDCNYLSNIYKNTLSINQILYTNDTIGISNPKYYMYNIDLKTGSKLSYQKVYKLIGFNNNNIFSKVKGQITSYFTDNYLDFMNEEDELSNKANNGKTYIENTISNYIDSVNNNTIKFYLDSNNKLNIIIDFAVYIDEGNIDTVITIN